ncbi:hypothetical protein Rhopal_002258-T1 [Rhodotorula paludigena]|uniref:Proteophosphoglycan ppg4 n=1 Tax=Rhodotorula paludigena TaxID=86838 RepID=A0AAV5GHC1_9BASI|nr:hypothetical protein Rhopal_002258-T1 [Rhodotorula paludigena]
MPRSQSISHSPFPPVPSSPSTSAQSAFAPPPSRSARPALSKASSLADLRSAPRKFLKRFHHKTSAGSHDDLWGCAGDLDEASEGPEPGMATSHAPPFPSSPSPSATITARTSPPRRPAPYAFPLTAELTAEELRRLERQREADLAASAALDYCSSHSHARKSSRSSSAAFVDTVGLSAQTLAGAIQQLHLAPEHARAPHAGLEPALPIGDFDAEGRPRSGSVVSMHGGCASSASECSSRPRTNDSLPSFAESSVSTVDSTGSFPPSPVHSPTLRSRPMFSGPYKAPAKVDTDSVAVQPRAYSFI